MFHNFKIPNKNIFNWLNLFIKNILIFEKLIKELAYC